jgi:hypothetical protein
VHSGPVQYSAVRSGAVLGLQQVRVQRDLQVPGIADLTLWPLPSQVTWYLLFEGPAQLILISDTWILT